VISGRLSTASAHCLSPYAEHVRWRRTRHLIASLLHSRRLKLGSQIIYFTGTETPQSHFWIATSHPWFPNHPSPSSSGSHHEFQRSRAGRSFPTAPPGWCTRFVYPSRWIYRLMELGQRRTERSPRSRIASPSKSSKCRAMSRGSSDWSISWERVWMVQHYGRACACSHSLFDRTQLGANVDDDGVADIT